MVALPFTTVEDYWDVFWGLRGDIKKALGAAGFEAALPQRVVKMKNT
jgi:small conductance mechanosensitive channel